MQLNDFHNIKKSKLLKESVSEDTSPKMIGKPDRFFDAEERQEAYNDLQDALQGNYMDDYIKDGSCPACAGSGYMDGEDEVYNDETEEYEEGSECDGFGNYGCDEGEMTYGSDGPSWVEIIKHDKSQADSKQAKADYPGDEEVVKGLANMMKSMDDPRMAYQQMQVDYPQMGRVQRSNLIAKAKQMAFPEESIKESDDPAPQQDIVDKFAGVSDKLRSYYIMKWAEEKDMSSDKAMCLAGYVRDGYMGAGAWNWRYVGMNESIQEGEERSIIQSGCVEKLVDEFSGRENQFENKEDFEYAIYQALEDLDVEDCVDPDMEVGGQRIGDFASGRVIDCCSSSSIIYDVMANMDLEQIGEGRIEDTFGTKTIDKHDKPEKKKKKQEEDMDKDNESDEAGVSKMLAKALGDPNRWTEMSAPELYAELESMDSKKAEMIALVAKMIYDVKLTEAKRIEEDRNMFNELRIDDNTYISDGNKELTPDEVGPGFYILGYDRDGRCFEMSKTSKENAKNHITDHGEYKVSDADITDFDGARYYYNDNMSDGGILHIKSLSGVKAVSENESMEESYDCDDTFFEDYGYLGYSIDENDMFEAEYRGRKVKLNKPMQGDVKKFKVYVKDPKTGNVKKVNFGHGGSSVKGKAMKIRKNNPKARKSFRARHNCDNPGPKTKARYWSCRKW